MSRVESGGALGPGGVAGWRAALAGMLAVLLLGPVLLAFAAALAAQPSLGVPGVRGGVVATSEPLAAQVGGAVLRAGGNAVDAAAAVAFALSVIEPQSSGIGGGGFMMIHLADSDETFVVDSRETAPAAATPDLFLRADGTPFAWDLRSTSGVAVGVPGMVRGIELALAEWGTMDFAEALAPAIDLAANGFRVSPRLAESIGSRRLQSEPADPAYAVARRVFMPGGEALAADSLLVQPELARTLRILARQGPDAFYTGAIAEAIVAAQQAARSDPEAPRLVGRMTLADLAAYRPVVRAPVEGRYRGYRVVSMPPPSSGGLTVIGVLKMLERFPLGDAAAGFGFGAPRTLNVMVEALRLAFADRAVWMGDADFVPVPIAGLLSDAYVARRSALIDPDARMAVAAAGDPRPFDPALAGAAPVRLAALAQPPGEGLNTTHFSVVDREGNLVSYTNTIESAWGTGLMVPGYGFLLNNELTDFNAVPAANPDPAVFDPGANDVAPGKRPRSSMAPTLLFRGDRPLAAYGSPGGSTIISSVLNATINLVDHRLDAQEAVDAARIAQTGADGATWRESGFDETAIAALEALGHEFRDPGDIGSVQVVVVDRHGERQYGAADRRRTGGVVTVERDAIAPAAAGAQ